MSHYTEKKRVVAPIRQRLVFLDDNAPLPASCTELTEIKSSDCAILFKSLPQIIEMAIDYKCKQASAHAVRFLWEKKVGSSTSGLESAPSTSGLESAPLTSGLGSARSSSSRVDQKRKLETRAPPAVSTPKKVLDDVSDKYDISDDEAPIVTKRAPALSREFYKRLYFLSSLGCAFIYVYSFRLLDINVIVERAM